jgi:hypothetical protein
LIGCATKEGLLSLVDKFFGEFYVNLISYSLIMFYLGTKCPQNKTVDVAHGFSSNISL